MIRRSLMGVGLSLWVSACGGPAVLGVEPDDAGKKVSASGDAGASGMGTGAGSTPEAAAGSTPDAGAGTHPAKAACSGARCVTLWSGPASLNLDGFSSEVVADEANVYFTNMTWSTNGETEYGDIVSVPISGGAATTLATDNTSILALAVDAENAYWLDDIGGNLERVAKGGGASTTLTSGLIAPDVSGTEGLVVEAGQVYFPSGSVDPSTNLYDVFDLARVPTGGGAVATVATNPMANMSPPGGGGIAFDDSNVYWMELPVVGHQDGCGGDCALPVYAGTVLSMPRAGGAITTLATTAQSMAAQYTTSLAVDATNVYFTSNGGIVSVPIGGGSVTTIATSPPVTAGFAFDGTSFYWVSDASDTADGGGVVARVAKGGGPVATVFSVSSAYLLACAVDSTSVYVLYALPTGSSVETDGGWLTRNDTGVLAMTDK